MRCLLIAPLRQMSCGLGVMMVACLSPFVVPGLSAQSEGADSVWWSVIDSLPPGVSVLAVDSLYSMVATDERGISLQLRLFGPEFDGRTFHGGHHSRWRYKYTWARDDQGRCKPNEVTILLRSVIHMPHLANLDEVADDLRRDWLTYSANLRTHEEGHREIVRVALAELRKRMLDLPSRECSDYPGAFDPLKNEIREIMRVRQKAYDEETEHGRTQGASWPLRRSDSVMPSPL